MTPLAEIARVLRASQRVLAISHVAPDGDAIGALLGLGWVLRAAERGEAERSVVLACADPVPVQFGFLPGVREIVAVPPTGPWDAVIALDASDTLRLGQPFRPADYGATPIINLDHHVTNLRFGTLNYVDTCAAATSQIIVDLADALEVPITRAAAICLLTGLVTDTLCFRTSNVTTEVMRTAIRLMDAGANLAEITELALNHRPLAVMRLWGQALSAVQQRGSVVWVVVTQHMRAQVGAPPTGDGSLVSYLITAPEAKIAAVFSETPTGKVEISLRARPGYDVSALALSLGGGGHPQAAGCTIDGPQEAAEARVLPLLFALDQGDADGGDSCRNGLSL